MKKYFITLLIILLPAISYANNKEDFAKIFLDDPILKDSASVEREKGRLTFTTEKTHDEVLAFYKEKMKAFYEEEIRTSNKEKLKAEYEEELRSSEESKDWDEAFFKEKLKALEKGDSFKERLKALEEEASFKNELNYLEKNINYRDWDEVTYIEDDGKLPWHSITISKKMTEGKTTVVIAKDKWTWIIGTLLIRYIAVFVVLLVLFVGMKVSGTIISSSVNKAEAKKA